MFTGIIETLGQLDDIRIGSTGADFVIRVPFASELSLGESIAVNGVCLTVVERGALMFRVQAGPETLARSNLGKCVVGDRVNLERSLRLCDRLGGHLVQGHVDGTARILDRSKQDDWEFFWFGCEPALTGQMIPKGSIAIDGISLTLVDVEPDRFSVALIPHTLAVTTLGFKKPGATVNLETDMIGKYVLKFVRK
jgi:riboflavin synthase